MIMKDEKKRKSEEGARLGPTEYQPVCIYQETIVYRNKEKIMYTIKV